MTRLEKYKGILFPHVEAEAWASTYNLSVETHTCKGCGKKMALDVPIAYQHYRGLVNDDHGCDAQYDQAIVVPMDADEKREWLALFG